MDSLPTGKRACGGQYKCYKDTLKANLKTCGIPPDDLEYLASDRITWRAKCKLAVEGFELNRIGVIREKRQRRKLRIPPSFGDFKCDMWSNLQFQNWTFCPQKDTLTMTRYFVSTSQSILLFLLCLVHITAISRGEIGDFSARNWRVISTVHITMITRQEIAEEISRPTEHHVTSHVTHDRP